MPLFLLIYKGGIFLYPIPSTETFVKSYKYLWYDEFQKEAMSYIDEDKNIFVHESCVNLSQEEHSQYIPFEMDRKYHGIDLMDMTLQIYFVNSQMGANISAPINVSASENRIRFGWLVDRNATAVSGTLMFEVRAIGDVLYKGTGDGQDLQYVWKTHPNSQITILKSLAGDTTFNATIDWYYKLVATINKQTNDTLTYKENAANSASEAKASEEAALKSEKEAIKQAADSLSSANASEASAQRSDVKAVTAESWAVGGTKTRAGEDENNAKYWCQTTENMLDTFRSDIATDVANLNTEIARANAAEESLSSRIDAEVTRANTSESALSDRIDNEKSRAQDAEDVLTANLTTEVNRAIDAENTLQANINNEASRAQDAEAVLTTNLTSEISRATNAESTLQSNIDVERTRAISAEDALTSNLSSTNVNLTAEITRATNAEDVLLDRINTENSRALSAESVLTTNLNATNTALSEESSRAMGAENALSTRVTSAENTLITLVNTDAGKSIRAIANEELVAQLIPSTAGASMDSLQEIASWISNHPDSAADMNSRIADNTVNINTNATVIAETQATVRANKIEIDAALATKADAVTLNTVITNINTGLDSKANASSVQVLSDSVSALGSSLSNKANVIDVNEALALKANTTDVEAELELKANKADVQVAVNSINLELETKANVEAVNESLSLKANAADVTSALTSKADSDHIHNYIHVGTEEPTDASTILWIDPVNGLKYYDGSAWVNVPMATS